MLALFLRASPLPPASPGGARLRVVLAEHQVQMALVPPSWSQVKPCAMFWEHGCQVSFLPGCLCTGAGPQSDLGWGA